MSADSDPGIWKQLLDWAWAVLALPMASLWKKAEGAVSKDDFKEYMREAREDRQETRATMSKLFDKVEEIRQDQHDQTVRLMTSIERKADK